MSSAQPVDHLEDPVGASSARLVAVGLLVVFIDIRIDTFDLVSDAIGWLLVAVGARRLVPRHAAYGWVLIVAAVAAALALPLDLAGGALASLVGFVTTLAVVLLCAAGAATAQPARRPSFRRVAVVTVVASCLLVLGIALARTGSAGPPLFGLAALGDLVAYLWLIGLMWAEGRPTTLGLPAAAG
ncbi:hypothetical protein [Nocardioides sp.]|uniref:hypothetical protein n=1 Tax=Nocardioides sp. TaxID=35761 RepID=UPI00351145F0